MVDKIDVNGIYGVLGMYTALIYNINVSTSVTSQGRALVSSASMMFESFLSNSVKFGSINEVLEFIRHVVDEKPNRKYCDDLILDKNVRINDCFAKVIDSCGYRWIPNENEMEIIWKVINNLGQEDLNRLYYKNNLYEFLSNSSMKKAIKLIMSTLEAPFFNSLKCPKEIKPQCEEFAYILKEYVYSGFMYIDRIDRCDNMMKSVIMISDTDSTIISLDAWYRFAINLIKDEPLKVKRYAPQSALFFFEKDEFGDYKNKEDISPIFFEDEEYDYDFENDELVEMKHATNPLEVLPEDNIRYSVINIMAFVLDILINDYMENFTKNNHSWSDDKKCRILMKNEFTFLRLLMTQVKKSYASLIGVQEGHLIPEKEKMDIKGIASMAKSSMADSTRDALKQILLEDILETPTIDQFKIIKHIAVLEKKITESVYSGSKEFYKPATIKSANTYNDPMRIQGVKASTVWNRLKSDDLPGINLEERNAITIAKCDITTKTIECIKESFPNIYNNAVQILNDPIYKGSVDSIAIPLDTDVPKWLLPLIDYKTIVNNNIGGFVYESVGIPRLGKTKVNYTNILQL